MQCHNIPSSLLLAVPPESQPAWSLDIGQPHYKHLSGGFGGVATQIKMQHN